ncbi:MAG: hypothetical protein ACRDSS_13610, partial [Actinocrinis sp.]
MAEIRPVRTSGARRRDSGHGAASTQPTSTDATKSAARTQLEQGRANTRQANQGKQNKVKVTPPGSNQPAANGAKKPAAARTPEPAAAVAADTQPAAAAAPVAS